MAEAPAEILVPFGVRDLRRPLARAGAMARMAAEQRRSVVWPA